MDLTYNDRYWGGTGRAFTDIKECVTKILGPSLQMKNVKTVTLISGESFVAPRTRDEDFWIVINARAHRREEMEMIVPRTLWGVQVDLYRDYGRLHEPSGDGMLIIDPKSGYAVAELVEDCLYILFDICNASRLNSETRKSLLSKIFTEAIEFIGKPIPSVKDIIAGDFELPGVDHIERMAGDIVSVRRNISQHIKHVTELTAQLENFDKNAGASRAFKRILEIPEIDTVTVSGERMTVRTHTMFAVHPIGGQLYELGRFQIILTLGYYADAQFTNLDRHVNVEPYGLYGHPHVERAGNHWCMGEGGGIIRLLQAFEIEAAIVFALKAIESVNESTEGNYHEVLQKFPKAKSRKKYPEKKDVEVDDEEVVRFARICDKAFAESRGSLKTKLDQVRPAIVLLQEHLLRYSFIQKMIDLSREALKSDKTVVTKFYRDQVAALKKVAGVHNVKVDGNQVDVVIENDTSLRKISIDYGMFSFSYFKKNGADHELPVSQLSATVPELLGSLDLETAITMILESVSNK